MPEETRTPLRQVRAVFADRVITVYQAYSPEIAAPAVDAGTFVPPSRLGGMTWIKPSFLWMMYRSGWGTKPGQERVLAIDITRDGFEWALEHSVLSSFEADTYASRAEWIERKKESPVRIQWDPAASRAALRTARSHQPPTRPNRQRPRLSRPVPSPIAPVSASGRIALSARAFSESVA